MEIKTAAGPAISDPWSAPDLTRAVHLSHRAHHGQRRIDGTSYATHPAEVASELTKHGAGSRLVVAAVLHDVVEKTIIDHH